MSGAEILGAVLIVIVVVAVTHIVVPRISDSPRIEDDVAAYRARIQEIVDDHEAAKR